MNDIIVGCTDSDQQNLEMRAVITGRVQGVGYRFFAQRVAAALGLVGYVRNLSDGGVEVLASGDRESLERLVPQLWEGPAASRVEGVATEWAPLRHRFGSFHIRF